MYLDIFLALLKIPKLKIHEQKITKYKKRQNDLIKVWIY